MTALPTRINRMPTPEPRIAPRRAVAFALNTIPYEWWKKRKGFPLSEDSLPVRAVLLAIEKAGYRIVEG